jgi:hypothetical protein
MKIEILIIGIIVVCVCLSGCDEVSDPSDLIEEGSFDSVSVSVYVRVNVKNEKGEEMTPNVFYGVKTPYEANNYDYPPSGGLIYINAYKLTDGESIEVTAVHTDLNGTYSDAKSITFDDASNKGRRESFTWAAECSIVVPGGIPISEEQAINVTVGAGVTVIYHYWSESKSNYEQVYEGVAGTVLIEMKGPNLKTLEFYESTKEGPIYVEGNFLLKRTEFIQVIATHQGSGNYVLQSYIHDGTHTADHYWNPELEIYVYMTHPE